MNWPKGICCPAQSQSSQSNQHNLCPSTVMVIESDEVGRVLYIGDFGSALALPLLS